MRMSVGVGPFRFYSQGRRRPTQAQLRARQRSWDELRMRLADRKARRAVWQPRVAPAWLVPTLRVLGWVWVAVFAFGSLAILGGLLGGWICLALVGVVAVPLWRTRRSTCATKGAVTAR